MNEFVVIDGEAIFIDHIAVIAHENGRTQIGSAHGRLLTSTELPVREVLMLICEAKRFYGSHPFGPWHYDYINGSFPKEIKHGS